MKRKDRALVCVSVAAVSMLGLVLRGGESKPFPRAETKCFMCDKMSHAQSVLEGLTLERFEQVSKHAVRLRDMTQSNLWYTSRQPDYMKQTALYQKSVTALYIAAVDKDLNAATEKYTEVIRNCVGCHRLVRSEQAAKGVASAKAKIPVGQAK